MYSNVNEQLLGKNRSCMTHKIGRNDPCPCGSGKKYKKCCIARETLLDNDYRLDLRPFMDIVRRHRLTHQPNVMSFKDADESSLSTTIFKYAEDLLSLAETDEDVEIILFIAIMAWNLAVGEDDIDVYLKHFAAKNTMPHTIYRYMKNLLDVLVQQKQEKYPFIDTLIVDFTVEINDEEIRLSLVSVEKPY